MRVRNILFVVVLLSSFAGCALFEATGDSVTAVGEGAGHAVAEVGHGAGHAVAGTGRAISNAAEDLD